MRIDELKKIAEENYYKFHESLEYKSISLRRKISLDGLVSNCISINSNTENQIFIENRHCDEKDLNVIKAAIEFVETPTEDREEEKKFYLRHRWIKPRLIYKNYLNYWIGTNEYWLDYKNETEEIQTQFTRKQIEEIKEKFDTDLADFKEVEVKDE